MNNSKQRLKMIVNEIAVLFPNNTIKNVILNQVYGYIDYTLLDSQADFILDRIYVVLSRVNK